MQSVKSDTTSIEQLIQMAKNILKEVQNIQGLDKSQFQTNLDIISEKYRTFSIEFPTVFQLLVYHCYFNTRAFKRYIRYRKTQPAIYRTENESIEDMIQYPLYVWELSNPHFDTKNRLEYIQELRKTIGDQHREHKKMLKEMVEEFQKRKQTADEIRLQQLKEQILSMTQLHRQ